MDMVAKFWSSINKTNDCWLWTGPLMGRGYGCIYVGNYKKDGAHRVSWRIHFGAIPVGLHVCHKCDTPKCVRPDHLFVGTRFDNMRDASAKGRLAFPKAIGERNAKAKLTAAKVIAMRELYNRGGITYSKVSALFGISKQATMDVIKRRHWRHVK